MTGEARLARLTAAAVSSLGSNDFHDRLLDLVGAAAPTTSPPWSATPAPARTT